MGCCGGGNKRPQLVRKQVIETSTKKAPGPVQKRLNRTGKVEPVQQIQRQYVIPREQCTKCGYIGMMVHIAGRERMQCSNVNCREIIQ